MKKVATILANGFEEIEALTIVDVLRRAGIDCDLVGMEETVTGSHQITVEVDRLWNGERKNHFCDLCSTNCLGTCRPLKR